MPPGWGCLAAAQGRDDGEALGGVVQGEAEDDEGAEGDLAGGERGADGEPFAEVVQADSCGDEVGHEQAVGHGTAPALERLIQHDEPEDGADGAEGEQTQPVQSRCGLTGELEVTNRTDAELTVPGYEGEPYLRVGPDGVWANRNSPAVYLNNDRYAQTPVPEGVDADAEPTWVRVADGPTYRWHDHRIHWMARTMPPQVKVDPGTQTVVQEWLVPFTLDGRGFAVDGQLRWVPPPDSWPWLLVGLAATTPAVALALRRPAGEPRRAALLHAGTLVLAAVLVIDLIHSVDDVLAVPATAAENLVALGQSLAFLLIAALGVRKGMQGGPGAATALGVGAAALALGVGLTHLPTLVSSQVATVLPVAFSRFVVALNLALLVPFGLVAWRAQELAPLVVDEATPLATEGT